jgi:hypothetical protein
MKNVDMKRLSFYAFLCIMLVIFMSSCKGSDGAAGAAGVAGADGKDGATGPAGPVTHTEESCVVCHGEDRSEDVAVKHPAVLPKLTVSDIVVGRIAGDATSDS